MKQEEHSYQLLVKTPNGNVFLDVRHKISNENEEDMQVTLHTTIQGKELSVSAETTEDSLMLLANSMPEGWAIQSCISCRHGHFCPVGNRDNELFCVTEFAPKEPRDLWNVTEDEAEREKRSRSLFDCCSAYQPQCREYYTYNNYYIMMDHC